VVFDISLNHFILKHYLITENIKTNIFLDESNFEWNTEEDKKLIGTWVSKKETNSKGQQEYLELEFNENRNGKKGMGIFLSSGEKKEADFFSQYITGWQYENDSIRISTYDSKNRKLNHEFFIIEKLTKNELKGYISNPELDKELDPDGKYSPIIFTYKREKSK